MKIVIKNLKRDSHEYEVDDITISEVKRMYAESTGKDVDKINLVYTGRILDDSMRLSDYEISDGCCIIAVKRVNKEPVKHKVEEDEPAETSSPTMDGPDFESSLNFAVELLAMDPRVNRLVNGNREMIRVLAERFNMEQKIMEMHQNMIGTLRTLITKDFFITEEDYEPLQYLMEITGIPLIATQAYVACQRDVAWAAMVSKNIRSMMEIEQNLD